MGGKLNPRSVPDYQRLAQQRLEPTIWDYLADGDNSDSNSNETNENAFTAVRLTPRPLRDVRRGHTRLNLFGQSLEHPIILAPIAYQRLFHPHGESACAMAASAQGGLSIISSLASQSFDTIVQAAREGGSNIAPWFQLYWQSDRIRTLRLLQRAMAAGCSAVVLTVDAPIKRATLQLPSHVRAINLEENLPHDHTVFNGWMAQAPTWDDVQWLRQQTTLPLLIKGILHPDDAAQAVAVGCDGIIVSNHGGRVLRGTPSSLEALKAITQRLQNHENRIPILLDSGIRSGRDVFVALAHGATAVLLGRPAMWGLAGNGAMGVAHVIRLLRDELEMTMALMGCAKLPTY